MTEIVFLCSGSEVRRIATKPGDTVMTAARRSGIPGIDAECGGNCACGTCHVHIHHDWMDRVGEPGAVEQIILDMAVNNGPTSRLSCQIEVTPELDGLSVSVAPRS